MKLSSVLCALAVVFAAFLPAASFAKSAAEIDQDVQKALAHLYETHPSAEVLSHSAKGILVFPSIRKGGFIVAGGFGEGALLENGVVTRYYNTVAASVGFQAGIQKYGYALFFMTDEALHYLKKSKGWSLGAGPSIVVVDEGFEKSFSTMTSRDGIYAFFFSSKGLMAGMSLGGTKITPIDP
jgi:lipid-binding SYLF domain-containing protein